MGTPLRMTLDVQVAALTARVDALRNAYNSFVPVYNALANEYNAMAAELDALKGERDELAWIAADSRQGLESAVARVTEIESAIAAVEAELANL